MLPVDRHRLLVIFGCLIANAIMVALAGWFVGQSRQLYEQRAEARSQTLALAIDQAVTSAVDRIDHSLLAITDELEHQEASGGLDGPAVDALLRRHAERVPVAAGIRVTDAAGRVIHGPGVDAAHPVNLADRPYFQTLAADAKAGLVMSQPIFGRILGRWVITFSRRYEDSAGRFAGIAYGSVPLGEVARLFTAFDAGPRGIITLRTADLGFLARHPDTGAAETSQPGNTVVSPELRRLAESGVTEATYRSRVAVDGLERVTTLRRLDRAPLMVTVGVAAQDYLGSWQEEVRRTGLLVGAFALFSVVAAVLLLRLVERVVAEAARNRMFLESASDGITILDEQGRVVEANRQFAAMLDRTPEEVASMNVTDWNAQFDADTLLNDILPRNFAAGTDVTIETIHRRRDGSLQDVEISVTFFHLDGRNLAYCASRDITEKKRQQRALEESAGRLRESEARLHAIIDAEPECVKVLTLDGRLESMNRAGLAMIEAESLEQVRGFDVTRLVQAPYRPAFAALAGKVAEGESGRLEFEITGLKGTPRWMETHMAPLRDEAGCCTGLLGVTRDITERKRAEEGLRRAEAIFRNTREGIVLTDLKGTIVAVNPAFTAITGYSAAEAQGRSNSLLKSTHHDAAFYQAMWHSLAETGSWQGELWNRRKDGSVYPEWLTISTVFDEKGEPTSYVGVFTDISRIKESEAEMEFLAHHDVLTSLPNRLLLLSRIEHAVAHGERSGRGGAVLFIDLDRFKHVNDSLGHPVGDEVLQKVARRLKSRLRESDTLARLGGDEFVVLLEALNSPEDAASVAQLLVDHLRTAIELDSGQSVYLGCSIGISMYPADSRDPHELVRYADAALYHVKDSGRGHYHFYTEALGQEASRHLALDAALRRALTAEEFTLDYQPLVDLCDRRTVGVEALVRWQPPGEPRVPPDRFIPHAEETGLIMPLGGWVLRRACAQVSAWRKAGYALDTLAVNLSPVQLRNPCLVDEVAAALAETGLPAAVLELEITENALVALGDEAESRLVALKALGLRLAIDDFGTGYSSLAYLKRFRVDKLKIDRSFVRDVPGEGADEEIVRTIVAMARNLHLEVLAEGVETEAQRDFLDALDCRLAQGYYFSPPLNAEALQRWLTPAPTPAEADPQPQ